MTKDKPDSPIVQTSADMLAETLGAMRDALYMLEGVPFTVQAREVLREACLRIHIHFVSHNP